MNAKFSLLSRSLLIAVAVSGMMLAATNVKAQDDPPLGAARLTHIQGSVSLQPNGVDDWGQAYPNMPVGEGDRVFSDQQAMGELQALQVRAYFSANADITLIRLGYQGVELGVGQGSFYVSSDGFAPGSGFSVQTPNGAITVAGKAEFRIDVYPDQQSTVITNDPNRDPYRGDVTLNGGGGFYMQLRPGESVQLSGTNPVYAQPLGPVDPDGFGRWSADLEGHRFNSISARYVSTELPGYDELDGAGDWQPESDYGPIWFPRVQEGWAPYRYGHWVNMPFYGWTWVADEPWGAAPFHYGRWVVVGNRWGWIPGAREQHPVWSPAQVVFAGGISVGGAGVSVWFPLGPGEAYRPWYKCSPQYVNQINITNIHESRVVHVQTTYVNVVNVTNVTNITYVNRTVGVTAMRQQDFAAGHPAQTAVVHVNPQQIEHVQPARPEAPVPAQRILAHPISKPAAAPAQRPVLINAKGQQAVAVAASVAKPIPVPVKAAPPAPRPIPGRVATGTPTLGGKPAPPSMMAPKPTPQASTPQPAAPQTRPVAPTTPGTMAPKATPERYNPNLNKPAAPAQPAPRAVPAPAQPAPKVTTPAPKPATQPAPPARTPPPVTKPAAPTPEAHPNPQTQAHPVPPAKGKDKEKKDEKKNPPPKPE